ncbi:MAG: hypothetical protein HY644_04945 [Acidobacteria bacterium]|nr:hypothetical protein [Acidobacteriota bacterium]
MFNDRQELLKQLSQAGKHRGRQTAEARTCPPGRRIFHPWGPSTSMNDVLFGIAFAHLAPAMEGAQSNSVARKVSDHWIGLGNFNVAVGTAKTVAAACRAPAPGVSSTQEVENPCEP